MKTFLKKGPGYIIGILILIMASSCMNPLNQETSESANALSIVDSEEYYIVEGDIWIPKDIPNALQIAQNIAQGQSTSNDPATAKLGGNIEKNVLNLSIGVMRWPSRTITYSLSSDMTCEPYSDTQIRNAFYSALEKWNAGANFNFVEMPYPLGAINIAITHNSLIEAPGYAIPIPSLIPPFSYLSNAYIYLNAYWISLEPYRYPINSVESIFLHELGHALGVDHEHKRDDSPNDHSEVHDAIPFGPYDPESIMNYNEYACYNNRLSIGDVSTIAYLYDDDTLIKSLFGDLNGDSREDLVLIGPHGKSWICLADTSGQFRFWDFEINTGSNGGAYQHFLADINGDGRADLFQSGPNNDSWVGLAQSNGNFTIWSHTISTGRNNGAYQPYLADINGDGRADLFQSGPNNDSWVGLAQSNGNFTIWSHTISTGRNNDAYQPYFADINGDGRADLIQKNVSANFWLGLATTDGNFPIWSSQIIYNKN